jgi:hypothetical protein
VGVTRQIGEMEHALSVEVPPFDAGEIRVVRFPGELVEMGEDKLYLSIVRWKPGGQILGNLDMVPILHC